MANVALVGIGSAGDVHPLLAIGRQLQARGHRAVVLTNPQLAASVRQAGLELEPIGTIEDYARTMAHPRLWHRVDGLGVLWRYLLRAALRPTYEALERRARHGRWVVVASPVAMGARIAQEALGLPLITVYTAATMLRTACHPMTLASWRVPRLAPRGLVRRAWTALDRHKLQPLVLPALQDLRGSLGLPPLAQSVFGEWMHSPTAGVALFPSWFAPAAPDWPAQVRQAGFALYSGDAEGGLPAALRRFLDAGAAPVVFMPGTGAFEPRAFYREAIAACARHGWRGVLLGPTHTAGLGPLPPALHASPYAPFALLLPRAAALVHHGGAGSCAQALRAGIPQLLLPQGYDQFDHAMRITRLGVGGAVPQARLARMGPELARVLRQPAIAQACRHWAAKVTGMEAADSVAQLVESQS